MNVKSYIIHWCNRNLHQKGYSLTREQTKDVVEVLIHERIHSKIYKRCGIDPVLSLELETKIDDECLLFSCDGKCEGIYPIKYNLPKYYPKFALIEFIQMLYDLIFDLLIRHKFIYNFFTRIKTFLKSLKNKEA